MTVPASARPLPIGIPSSRVPFVDTNNGTLIPSNGLSILADIINYINGSCRMIPCEETGTNVLALRMLSVSPLIRQYNDYDVYSFVAAATSTGPVTAFVVTPQAKLATLNVYKNNGAAQATTNDVLINLQYQLTYVDSLNNGAGGFVLR